MPILFEFLGALIAGGLSLLSTGISGLAAGGLARIILAGALVYGATALSRSLAKSRAAEAPSAPGGGFTPPPQPQDIQQAITQSVPPRRRHYGRVKASGYHAFFDSVGGIFYQNIMTANGRIHAYEEHWLNDAQVLLGNDPVVVETPFGAKTGPSSMSYGVEFDSPQAVEYALIFPADASNGYARHWITVTHIGGSFITPVAFIGNLTATVYGQVGASPEVQIASLVFANSLIPQFLNSTDDVTLFNRIRITLVPGAGWQGGPGAAPPSTAAFVGIGDLDVGYTAAGAGSQVVATVEGGGLTEDPFTTSLGSAVVTVYHPAHDFVTGATVAFTGLTAAVNGIPTSEFAADHSATVVDPDNYTVTLTTPATSAGSAGGAAVRFRKTNSGANNQYLLDGIYRAHLYTRLGQDNQAAHKELMDAFPTKWGVAHRLAGIANVLCTFQDVPAEVFSAVYPRGIPQYRAVLAGALVYDPRDSTHDPDDATTWDWSDNAALVVLDFLTHADGMGRPRASFDEDSFADAADVCDETVLLKDGGSETRYRISASYDLTERPSDVLTRMLAACDGFLYPTADGLWGLRVGKWYPPTVSVENKDILEYMMEQGNNALVRFNQLKLTYTDPLNDYLETEADPWEDADSIEQFGTLVDQLKLLEVPSHSQARRLGKIAMAKSNPEWRGRVKTNLAGLAAMGEAVINLELTELGVSGSFLVSGVDIAGDLSHCVLEVSSLAATAYDWDPDTEEGTAPISPAATTPLQVPDVPTNFTVLAGQIIIQGSTVAAAAAASWDIPDRDTIAHEVQYKLSADTDWISSAVPAGSSAWTSGVLNDGASYDFRLRAIGPGGAPSDWTDTETVVMTADTTAPAAPTALSSSLAGTTATVQWTNPTSANFYATRVYRGTTAVFGAAALVAIYYGGNGLTKTHQDTLAPGTYYWWVTAINASSVASGATGPTTQTIV